MMQVFLEVYHPLSRICSRECVSVSMKRHGSRVKVPTESTWKEIRKEDLPKVPEIDTDLINHLERLSLVEFNNQEGVDRLTHAIQSANQLFLVDITGVEPLDSVLEDRSLFMRADTVTEGNVHRELLANAAKTEEDYFVAPPGNIPLKSRKTGYGDTETT